MSEKVIDKLIVRYIVEICIATFFIVLSYTGISSNNLKESSAVAQFNRDGYYEIQYEFDRNVDDVLAFENLLDMGELSVRNPNSKSKETEIYLIIYTDIEELSDLKIEFGDTDVDLSKIETENGTNKILLARTNLRGYDKYINSLSIYGNPYIGTTFAYDFEIKESFLT